VQRSVKVFLTPGWLALHALVWASAVAMIFLGRWQLQVSDDKHFNLQNFGYALQWWAFSAFAVVVWLKSIRDTWRGRAPVASSSGELVVRRNGLATNVVYVGPAELTSPAPGPGQPPITYRGYVMPQSTTSPARSDGDPVRGAYNDHLWQLALADSAPGPRRGPRDASRPGSTDPSERAEADDQARPEAARAVESARPPVQE